MTVGLARSILLILAAAIGGSYPHAQSTLGLPEQPMTPAASTTDSPSGKFDWSKSKFHYQKTFWLTGYVGNAPTGLGFYSLQDWIDDELRERPPKSGYPRTVALPQGFGEVDFSYLDNPKTEADFWERLHRVHLGDNWVVGTGGEYRNRFNFEGNSRLSGRINNYDLNRLRVFGEVIYQDEFRFIVEMLDARSTPQALTPLGSDRNFADFLNLFVDIRTFRIADENVYARIGRQQMLLGSQRIISPSDWGFTGRTFDGVRFFRRSDTLDVNLFWLRPVVPTPGRMDSADSDQNFAGVYTTYRPEKDRFLDTYYLYYNNRNSAADARVRSVGSLSNIAPYDVHTLGFRYAGKSPSGFLWDSENMLQLGSKNQGAIFAGNLSNGIGYHFADLPLNPTTWMYFDYASGSNKVGGGNTFNQLFPLAHYYLGQMDYIGRANIEDLNFHLYLYPSKWITLNTQYHIFALAQAKDALYSTSAGVSRSDPTGKAGRNVGSELDISASFHLSHHIDILTVYTHFFPGRFLNETGPSGNANTVFLVFNYRW